MHITLRLFFVFGFSILLLGMKPPKLEWGFFGHRKINKMAVFTLPQEMLGFYKKNIDYVTRHAIDPDTRRYASEHEGIRHYINLDQLGDSPIDNLPRELSDAISQYSQIYYVNNETDSTLLLDLRFHKIYSSEIISNGICEISLAPFIEWNDSLLVFGQREEYDHEFELSNLPDWIKLKEDYKEGTIIVSDKFSQYGIAPYYIEHMFHRLKRSFRKKEGKKILQLSSEIGHYLADIHVPLHTTKNYNGADTDQLGIHAFWETRLPELYAEKQYDFMVGKAEYIQNQNEFIWNTVFKSFALVDQVLGIEKSLSSTFASDMQYCYEERNNKTVRLECEEYANTYHERMNGMVEKRMQESIHAVGSFWFSAWILAGQPDLSELTDDINWSLEESKDLLESKSKTLEIRGRKHTN